MNSRDKILLWLYTNLGDIKVLNYLVSSFYKHIIFQFIKIILKLKHPNLIGVHYRNSVSSTLTFNAFLSDIDVTLVIEDNSDFRSVILTYFKLKSFFIMLDSPEIYYKNEDDYLSSIREQPTWKLVDFTWNIRKINWSLDTLRDTNNQLTKIKKLRAIEKSFKKIISDKLINNKNEYNLMDFPALTAFIPKSDKKSNLCYYSFFLETNKINHIKFLTTTDQYEYMNSLMPGEQITSSISSSLDDNYLKNKIALEFYELYLTKSTSRLKLAHNLDIAPLLDWITYLEKKLGITE